MSQRKYLQKSPSEKVELTTDEYRFVLGLIADATFPGKEVLVVADIVNKIKSHVESIERGTGHPTSSPGQHNRKG